jgi:PBSX family phage terminase large subunit
MSDKVITFSPKQEQVISLLKHDKLKRINLLEGSVRSGKTWISLVLWAMWVANQPKDASFLMAAKTLTALERNNLNLLTALVGSENFKFSIASKKAELFGRCVYLEGASDVRAENKIRGLTLCGAYIDELTLIDEDFFVMMLSRLSEPDAKLFATTNPDSPNHWLMTNYIQRAEAGELEFLRIKFSIEDNPYLTKEYVKSLKSEYTGVFYQRFIKGEWVAAEGVVYPEYADNPVYQKLKAVSEDQAEMARACEIYISGEIERFTKA